MSRFIARHFSAPLNGCFVQCLEEHYISLHQSCQEAYLGFLYEYLWKFQRLLELESSSKEKILSPLHSTDLCVLKLKWIYTRYKLNQLTSLSICWCNDWALQMSTCQSLIVIYVHGSLAKLTYTRHKSDETNYHWIYEFAYTVLNTALLATLFNRELRLILLLAFWWMCCKREASECIRAEKRMEIKQISPKSQVIHSH